jgi:proteasome lid subunit RPN8/RPN11
MPGRVLLPAAAVALMRRHAQSCYPGEACGMLIGPASPESDGEVCIDYAVCAGNAAADPRTWYTLDPGEQLRALKAAREVGLDMVGFYHSHPDAEAKPSKHDLAQAWPVYVYVIVPVREGVAGEPRAWRLEGQAFVELTLTTT